VQTERHTAVEEPGADNNDRIRTAMWRDAGAGADDRAGAGTDGNAGAGAGAGARFEAYLFMYSAPAATLQDQLQGTV
jgi:hypothetical protein